jgi:hypothetical protein
MFSLLAGAFGVPSYCHGLCVEDRVCPFEAGQRQGGPSLPQSGIQLSPLAAGDEQ